MLPYLYKKWRQLSWFDFIVLLLFLNLVLIGMAIVFYPIRFLFWQNPISSAGAYYTDSGISNLLSSRIYSVDMILSGLFTLSFAYRNFHGTSTPFRALLLFLAGGGFVIAGFGPDDIRHVYHIIGSALVFASFWIIASSNLFELRSILPRLQYYLLQILVQLPIFTYAIAFFASIDPFSYIIQKISLFTLCVVLLYSTRLIGKQDRN